MLAIKVNTDAAEVQLALRRGDEVLSPESVAKVAVEAAADVVRDHFITLSRTRHRPAQRLNYYLQAADSVIRETQGGDALIRIPHAGVAQRLYGGTIKPSGRVSAVTGRPVRRLAIGLSGTPGEGHVPADFGTLFCVLKKGAKRGDLSQTAFLVRKQGAGLQYLFALVSEVTQNPDPGVLPADAALLDAAAESILDLYDAATQRNP